MATSETSRFRWPLPLWNADWQKWQAKFADLAENQDATAFALMEHLTLINKSLPTVAIVSVGPDFIFTPSAVTEFMSRTFGTTITVSTTPLTLAVGNMVGVYMQAGAVGPQSVDWELRDGSAEIDPSFIVLGYVNADSSITWFNGATLAVGVPLRLFEASAGVVWTGGDEYWIDYEHGVDAVGRGAINAPFKTIAFAATQVSVPLLAATFQRAVVFHVASGTYSDPVTLPGYRWAYMFMLTGAIVTGDIAVEIDSSYRFGSSTAIYAPTVAVWGTGGAVINGITVQNVNVAPGWVTSGTKNLAVVDCTVAGSIQLLASGDFNYPTENLRVGLHNSTFTSSGAYIRAFGEDIAAGVAGANWTRNQIFLSTQSCVLACKVDGDVQFCSNQDTRFAGIGAVDAGPREQILGSAHTWSGFCNCEFSAKAYFGSLVEAFGGGDWPMPVSQEIQFDAHSYQEARTAGVYFYQFPATPEYVLTDTAQGVGVDASGFAGLFDVNDTDVQACLNKVDMLSGAGGFDAIYVDGVRGGDDAAHDGSIALPYATLAYASSTVTTGSLVEFQVPIMFVMAPGIDASNPILPYRQYIHITGNSYILTGTISYYIDGTYMFGGGTLDNYTRLLTFRSQAGACVVSGRINHQRQNPALGGNPGGSIVGFFQGVTVSCAIENQPSAGVAAGQRTGVLNVVMFNTATSEVAMRWGGTHETNGALLTTINSLNVYAYSSLIYPTLTLCGVVGLGDIVGSDFAANLDYNTDVAGGAYDGAIGGASGAQGGFVGTWVNSTSAHVGWGGGVISALPLPIKADATAIDNPICPTGCIRAWTFDNATYYECPDRGFQRGTGLRALSGFPADNVVMVKQVRSALFAGEYDGNEVVTALTTAAGMMPAGAARAATNRVEVWLPLGTYRLPDATSFGIMGNYIDIISFDPVTKVPAGQFTGSIIKGDMGGAFPFFLNNSIDCRMKGVTVQNLGTGPAMQCTDLATGWLDCVFESCVFDTAGDVAVSPHAAVPGLEIYGTWRNCQSAQGLVGNCVFKGVAEWCDGDDYSFGGSTTGIAGGFVAVARNCNVGDYSCGYSDASDVTCAGILDRVVTGDYSAGVCDDATGMFAALYAATANDCTFGDRCTGWWNKAALSGDNTGVMVRCIMMNVSDAVIAGLLSRFYDTLITAQTIGETYAITGEIDGTSPPVVVVGEYYVVTVTGAPYTEGEVYLGTAGLPDTWVLVPLTAGEIMLPGATYGSWEINRYYEWNGTAWVRVHPNSCIVVQNAATPMIDGCKLITPTTANPSITATTAHDIKAMLCRSKANVDTTINNLIPGGNNVVDSDMEV